MKRTALRPNSDHGEISPLTWALNANVKQEATFRVVENFAVIQRHTKSFEITLLSWA